MQGTSVHVGDLLIHAPVHAGTCLLLTVQCLAYFVALRADPGERARGWSLFFLTMALANAAGAVKHAFPDLIGAVGMLGVLAVSNAASGLSTFFAQRATVVSRSRERFRPLLGVLVRVQLGAYLAANVLLGPKIELLIANTVVGLVPVIVAEARGGARPPGGRIATGIALSLLTGAVYLGRLSPNRWFDHIDVAHLVMGVSLYLIGSGVRRGRLWIVGAGVAPAT